MSLQSTYRQSGAGFVADSGRPLVEAVAGADGAFYDDTGRKTVAIVIAAQGGTARCRLTAGRSGSGGGFTISREFDVAPQFDAVIQLNYKSFKIEIVSMFDSDTFLSYASAYEFFVIRPPYLRLYTVITAAQAFDVPAGALDFTPDAADTWSWAVQSGAGLTMSQVLGGDATERYPVLGQRVTPGANNVVLWTIAQP